MLLHDGDVGFIDFDGAAMAEPALDLGRFRAKLRDIGISTLTFKGEAARRRAARGEPGAARRPVRHVPGRLPEQGTVSTARVALWETCDLMTGMLHAWTKVRLLRLDPRLVILKRQLSLLGAE